MIKLYSLRAWLPRTHHIDLLEPFFGALKPFAVSQGMDRNQHYKKSASELFEISNNIDDSDFIVLPADYKFYKEHRSLIKEIERFSKINRKKVIVFSHSDRHQKISFSNALVFRTSGYKSLSITGRDYVMPFSFGDLLSFYNKGKVIVRDKTPQPVVGFCGNVVKGRVKAIAKRILLGPRDGFDYARLRNSVLNSLLKSDHIETNFVLRSSHFAGAAHGNGIDEVKRVFYDNLINSDYLVAMRGNGNYSYRFYEIMQCGRIPFLIDTDCDFPFDQEIQIRKHIPVLSHVDSKHSAEYIRDYHHALHHDDFAARQLFMRNIWESWYTNHGFFMKLHDLLATRK